MQSKTVFIPAITCGHCVGTITHELSDLDGVAGVNGDPASKNVTVEWDAPADWNGIEELLRGIGYPPA